VGGFTKTAADCPVSILSPIRKGLGEGAACKPTLNKELRSMRFPDLFFIFRYFLSPSVM
jgi:hypothetical protein